MVEVPVSVMRIRCSGSRFNGLIGRRTKLEAAHGHLDAPAPLHELTFCVISWRLKNLQIVDGEGRSMLSDKLPKLGQGDVRLCFTAPMINSANPSIGPGACRPRPAASEHLRRAHPRLPADRARDAHTKTGPRPGGATALRHCSDHRAAQITNSGIVMFAGLLTSRYLESEP